MWDFLSTFSGVFQNILRTFIGRSQDFQDFLRNSFMMLKVTNFFLTPKLWHRLRWRWRWSRKRPIFVCQCSGLGKGHLSLSDTKHTKSTGGIFTPVNLVREFLRSQPTASVFDSLQHSGRNLWMVPLAQGVSYFVNSSVTVVNYLQSTELAKNGGGSKNHFLGINFLCKCLKNWEEVS